MGFHDDDTQILPVLTDGDIHKARYRIEKTTNPMQLPRRSIREAFEYKTAANFIIQADFAECEARVMALFTPPFAAHPAIVIQDAITYLSKPQEGSTWIVADSKLMPYYAMHETTQEWAEKKAIELTESFASSNLSE